MPAPCLVSGWPLWGSLVIGAASSGPPSFAIHALFQRALLLPFVWDWVLSLALTKTLAYQLVSGTAGGVSNLPSAPGHAANRSDFHTQVWGNS